MPQYSATIALSALNGTNGFTLAGLSSGDRTGNSVSSAGDINGDGFDDFLIGAFTSSVTESVGGVAYIVFGKGTAFSSSFDLSTLDGTNGFRIDGAAAGDEAGTSVASAGDINSDGFADIIIGARNAEVGVATDAGSSYVIYGSATFGSGVFDLGGLTGSDAFTIVGIDAGDRAGTSVGGGGDFNGDGIEDFLIGAPSANGGDGESYVIFGNASGFAASVNPSTITGTSGALPGVILAGGTGSSGGTSIDFIGDVNGDGRDDVIYGGPDATANGNASAGSSYVVFGSNSFSGASILPGNLDGTNGFRIDGIGIFEDTGFSVAPAGDINGDGIADMIMGAPGSGSPGKAYVVFGKSTAYASVLNLTTLASTDGFSITGLANGDLFGEAVASAGDVNGDGFGDIIVGARTATANSLSGSGETYVIFGKASGFGTSFDLTTLDGTNGFRIQGAAAGDRSGKSVASAGDINGDGLDDLVVGANQAGGGGVPGAGYIVLGQLSDVAVNLTGTLASQKLVGSNFNDTLSGLGGDDQLWGHGGNDTLDGGSGNDTMRGGTGNDFYLVDSVGDQIIETVAGGTSDLVSSFNLSLNLANYANVENLALTGSAALNLTGDANANTLTGNAGANILSGLGGANTLTGAGGNDTFVFDGSGNVTITDFGSTYLTATLTGASQVPVVVTSATGTGSAVLNLGENRVAIEINTTGLDWDGLQTPGTTADNVSGFHIHQAAVGVNGAIIEDIQGDPNTIINAALGRMTSLWTSTGDGLTPALVTSLLTNGLYFNVHTIAHGGGEIRGQIGNASANADRINVTSLNIGELSTIQAIMSDSGANAILFRRFNGVVSSLTLQNVNEANLTAAHFQFAGAAAQILNGTNNIDDLFGAGGNDTLNGLGGNDRLFGETDNDTLNGGLGNDTMYGGQGNDTYVVDSTTDLVLETALAGSGTDGVQTGIALTALAANVENLALTGTLAINGVGNALANFINATTNSAANELRGMAGNDIYVLGGGDTVNETIAGSTGTDTVISSFAQTLATNVENLTFTGAAAVLGTGNTLNNVLNGSGNTAANQLRGLGGNDTYVLGAGDIANESFAGSAGIDTVQSALTQTLSLNVENLTLTGAAVANGTGNAIANVMIGNTAANVLNGLLGNDTLTGGAGNDTFVFNTAPNAATNKDTITDFNVVDTIQLDDAVFAGLGAVGAIGGRFFASATGLAHDADDRIIYNTATGALTFDSNGNVAGGTIISFATLSTKPVISAADVVVI